MTRAIYANLDQEQREGIATSLQLPEDLLKDILVGETDDIATIKDAFEGQ